MPSANQRLMRAINQYKIVDTIRKYKAISRTEISEITGQSRTTITTITAQMIKKGLIFEKQTKSNGVPGRKHVLLALNPDAAFAVGIKLTATDISCSVVDMQGEIRSSFMTPARLFNKKIEFIVDTMQDIIRYTVNKSNLALSSISGIGVAVPGLVDIRTGTCCSSPIFNVKNVPLRDFMENNLKIKTYIENSANALALNHQWFGEGQGVDNFLVVELELGVGIGIIVNGHLYRGEKGFSGEFGHLIVDPEGDLCFCGNKGCLITVIMGRPIMAKAEQIAKEGLWKRKYDTDLTFDEVINSAKEGQKELCEIFSKAGYYFGIGLSDVINLFNPKKIIISGQGANAGDLFFKPMYEVIEKHVIKDLFESDQIVIPEWDPTDWERGAATVVLQELYKSPFTV
jgi:predicted NBD/HSP70 family sugar kinase